MLGIAKPVQAYKASREMLKMLRPTPKGPATKLRSSLLFTAGHSRCHSSPSRPVNSSPIPTTTNIPLPLAARDTSAMTQATLHSARLKFVPLAQDHYALIKELDQDPDVMKHIGFGRPLTDDETKQVHEWLLNSASSVPGLGTWVAYAGNDPIGWWILAPTPVDKDKPTENFSRERSETGYRLLREFWGKGYATEGSKELIRHAFQDLGLTEVFGETMTVNEPSRKVMAKCGMKHVDTWFNEYPTPPPGIEEGEVRYRITKEEWQAQQ